jgi:hypothetical protein
MSSGVAKSKRLEGENRKRSGNNEADPKMSNAGTPSLDLKDAIDSAR